MATDETPLPSPSSEDSQEYLVDDLLPVGEVNLIAGPSGSGKTTLALQCLQDFIQGRLVLGKPSHPGPVVYVSCDRSLASIKRTFKRVGLPWGAFPAVALRGSGIPRSMGGVRNWLSQNHPGVRLLFIEAIGSLVPEGKINDYEIVARFLSDLGEWAVRNNICIWGSTHAAKVKENERYKNTRQRILGTVAWAGFTETVFTIEPMEPDNVDDQRRMVMVEPRESQPFSLKMTFDPNGRLITLDEDANRTMDSLMDQELEKLPFDYAIRTETFCEIGARLNISKSTVKRWIDSALGRDFLRRVRQGMYMRVRRQ